MMMNENKHLKFPDFHAVEPKHAAIHAKLTNWGKVMGGWSRDDVSPMFSLVKSDNWEREASSSPKSDVGAANVLNGAIQQLPTPHRAALTWCYCENSSPSTIRRKLGATREYLATLIRDGRQMLVNRGY